MRDLHTQAAWFREWGVIRRCAVKGKRACFKGVPSKNRRDESYFFLRSPLSPGPEGTLRFAR